MSCRRSRERTHVEVVDGEPVLANAELGRRLAHLACERVRLESRRERARRDRERDVVNLAAALDEPRHRPAAAELAVVRVRREHERLPPCLDHRAIQSLDVSTVWSPAASRMLSAARQGRKERPYRADMDATEDAAFAGLSAGSQLGRPRRQDVLGVTSRPMEHAQLAEIAALVGALGAVLALDHARRHLPAHRARAARRWPTGGLGWSLVGDDDVRLLLGRPGGALRSSWSAWRRRSCSPSRSRATRRSSPSHCSRSHRSACPSSSAADEAFLLLPLYLVIAAAVLALAYRILRGERPRASAVPARAPARRVRDLRVDVVPVDLGRARRAASRSRSSSSRSSRGSRPSRAARSRTGSRARCS